MSATKTVLYVEDEPLIRELSVLALEDAGFEVVVAVNGSAALKVLTKGAEPFSAVVTVTGAGGHGWQAKGVRGGIMIGKPFTPDRLVAVVESVLRRE
jgi:DNA-binding response OmpR family regulator